ncbi:formate/nitrite family transporter [Wohlfahrtiimonas larvae]|uniref:Formate transporter FocA n=1 Tax=Wohlfahrtiimonas larvae TaxID=1157986 RepID=A0ABP9MXU4_9GAMM|nr:formate/nitrite family transporter [Wohlfahrtiimonas larvae]
MNNYKVAAEKALDIMSIKANKPSHKVLLCAMMAGVFIGLGFIYCVIANVQGAGKIVGGLVFSLGLLLTLVLGADLFTSTTMTVMAVASQKITLKKMLSNWGLVYLGNFIGALVLVGLIIMSGHPFDNGGQIGLYYISTAEHKLAHTFVEAVGLGILCNIMVCLAVWMSLSAHTLIDKMVAVLLPVGLFIAAGFEHSVANMFMVPAGIYSLMLATPEMLNHLTDTEILRTTLTWHNFFIQNLLPVTLGNIIGGSIFVSLFQWVIHLKD